MCTCAHDFANFQHFFGCKQNLFVIKIDFEEDRVNKFYFNSEILSLSQVSYNVLYFAPYIK